MVCSAIVRFCLVLLLLFVFCIDHSFAVLRQYKCYAIACVQLEYKWVSMRLIEHCERKLMIEEDWLSVVWRVNECWWKSLNMSDPLNFSIRTYGCGGGGCCCCYDAAQHNHKWQRRHAQNHSLVIPFHRQVVNCARAFRLVCVRFVLYICVTSRKFTVSSLSIAPSFQFIISLFLSASLNVCVRMCVCLACVPI